MLANLKTRFERNLIYVRPGAGTSLGCPPQTGVSTIQP